MPSPEAGFTLIEVLVATVLLAVGLLALVGMQTTSTQGNAFGNQLTEATILAQDQMEALRQLNDQYLVEMGKPPGQQNATIVDDYNARLIDTGNWNTDHFDWSAPNHADPNNPVDATGTHVAKGGYTRVWSVADNVPMVRTQTVHVRVTWGNGRQVLLTTIILQ
jgi:prepilin-type N-terminal cleavage/methylation domain-containing protein